MMNQHYIIRLTNDGLPCWHIVDVSKLKEPLLKKIHAGAQVDVSALGTILASGWGKEVPHDIKQQFAVNE